MPFGVHRVLCRPQGAILIGLISMCFWIMPRSSQTTTTNHAARGRSDEVRGLWLGLLGVVIFAVTLPMTRLAVGPSDAPQLDPTFVTAGRAALAGICSLVYLLVYRAQWPSRHHWRPLGLSALCTVVGFPLFLALALRDAHATHAAVITGVLPLATAVAGALYFRQRPSFGFWACAVAGCGLVLAYAVYQGGGQVTAADFLLLLAVISAAVGYLGGARVSAELPAPEVICWVLVMSLPFTLPASLMTFPDNAGDIRWESWAALGYVALFSMWLGFFAWYRGLVLGGMVRVSQVQLVQPFLSLIFAVPILGESLDAMTIVFSLAVIATVFISKKMSTGRPQPAR